MDLRVCLLTLIALLCVIRLRGCDDFVQLDAVLVRRHSLRFFLMSVWRDLVLVQI